MTATYSILSVLSISNTHGPYTSTIRVALGQVMDWLPAPDLADGIPLLASADGMIDTGLDETHHTVKGCQGLSVCGFSPSAQCVGHTKLIGSLPSVVILKSNTMILPPTIPYI